MRTFAKWLIRRKQPICGTFLTYRVEGGGSGEPDQRFPQSVQNCLLNQLRADQKKALLPAMIVAIQNAGNWGLRNNAALALRYHPEQREEVAPILGPALQDSQPPVRLLAADTLDRVDPDAAKKAGTTLMIIAITKDTEEPFSSPARGDMFVATAFLTMCPKPRQGRHRPPILTYR